MLPLIEVQFTGMINLRVLNNRFIIIIIIIIIFIIIIIIIWAQ